MTTDTKPRKKKRKKAITRSKPGRIEKKVGTGIIEIPISERAGDTERDDKKSINWKDDPEILQRLALVASLMNQNFNSWEIAEKTKVSISTAKRDIGRVRELWREDAKERLANTTDVAIAQYGSVIRDASEQLKKAPVSLKAQFMNVILRAQERIDKVTGIADPTSLTGPNGGPIPIQVTDINKIRDERWEKVQASIAALAQQEKPKESDGTGSTTNQQPA